MIEKPRSPEETSGLIKKTSGGFEGSHLKRYLIGGVIAVSAAIGVGNYANGADSNSKLVPLVSSSSSYDVKKENTNKLEKTATESIMDHPLFHAFVKEFNKEFLSPSGYSAKVDESGKKPLGFPLTIYDKNGKLMEPVDAIKMVVNTYDSLDPERKNFPYKEFNLKGESYIRKDGTKDSHLEAFFSILALCNDLDKGKSDRKIKRDIGQDFFNPKRKDFPYQEFNLSEGIYIRKDGTEDSLLQAFLHLTHEFDKFEGKRKVGEKKDLNDKIKSQ